MRYDLARYEDGMVCSAVYDYLRCPLVFQQNARYGHNQCGYQCGVVQLPVRCSAVTSAGYELALGSSQARNIWLLFLSRKSASAPRESNISVQPY